MDHYLDQPWLKWQGLLQDTATNATEFQAQLNQEDTTVQSQQKYYDLEKNY